MEHKDCCGKIVENLSSQQATEQFKCLKCGKIWGIFSDLSDIRIINAQQDKTGRPSVFLELEDFRGLRANVPDSILNWLFNDRLRRVLRLLDFLPNMQGVGLDVGCAKGYLTQYLSQRLYGTVIGIDVYRNDLYKAKFRARLKSYYEKPMSCKNVEFVCCSVNHLPFKRDSIDMVACVSVLEHINDLEGAIRELSIPMKKRAWLVAGYPIETSLFTGLLKLFLPSGLVLRDPRIWGKEKFERSPETHKQSFTTIRYMLQKHFVSVKREKSFSTILPDQISWYECAKMSKDS